MTASHLPYLDAATVGSLSMTDAMDALERALVNGLDPAGDPPRTVVNGDVGQLLVMPSAAAGRFSVKLVSVAPATGTDTAGSTLPRIQGLVVLFDATTLAPAALVDGAALTSVRTPAVSALAVRHLARPDARRLVVFGSGPQAEGHIAAMTAVRPIDDVVVVGRDAGRAATLVARVAASGMPCRVGAAADVADADLVVCATTASDPVFDGRLVRDGTCVVAVGSHEPGAREVDTALVRRSRVVVEETSTALREAGDLVLAGVEPDDVTQLADVVRRSSGAGSEWHADRPTLVKTVGMAWQDAVVAAEAVARLA
jgi:ornithine cyclodeaminase